MSALSKLFLIFILSICILKAQDEHQNIENIKFHGLTYISNNLAQDIVNIKVGDKIDLKKVNDSILTFYSQGYFSDIYATFKDGVLSFHFKERPAIASVEIKGYGTQSEKDTLYGQIGIKKGDTFSEIKLNKGIDTLKQILSYKGYYGSVVEPDLKYLNDNKAVSIIINVNRGDTIKIYKSEYFGAKSLKHRQIESLSANKQKDPLGFLWGLHDGKLVLNELELDNLRIQDVYKRYGYLDANISKPLLNVDMDSKKAELYYQVEEGVQYTVKSISFEMSHNDKDKINEYELRKNLNSKVGQIVDIQNMRSDMELLKYKMANLGYAFASATPDIKQDRDNKEVEILYHLNYGQKVKISDVVVSGNTKTWDRIIRREVLIAPGDEYSLEKIKSSENALNRAGYFEKVIIEEKRISDSLMELVVKVTEGRTGDLSFGLGYGSFYGFTLNGSVNERNLFGSGLSASIYANLSLGGLAKRSNDPRLANLVTQQVFNISLTNPRVLDSAWSFSPNIYYSQYLNYVYTQQTYGFGFTVGKLLTPTLRFNVGYDLNLTNTFGFIDIFGNPQPAYAKYFSSTSDDVGSGQKGIWNRNYSGANAPIKSSITPSIVFDNTDDYYFPKNGISLNFSTQFSGLFGDVRNAKIYGKAAFYYDLSKMIKLDLIGRYKTQVGYIARYSREDFLSLNDTFYMGGVGSVRGYTSYSITPIDSNGLRTGGDGMFTNSIELSYGLVPSAKLRVALYADYGILSYAGSNNQADFIRFGTLASPTNFLTRGAAGASIEWVSPIGPIVIVFPFLWYGPTDGARAANKLFSYEEASKIRSSNNFLTDYPSYFEFTMGTRF